ncbi:hypothetical protein KRX19_09205 [Cardiobacteriaceae bacterium TAE3-ERU3]|nr:hypothetical protein [Cardiobacteriaceae bacterium TAE3-ERU3]
MKILEARKLLTAISICWLLMSSFLLFISPRLIQADNQFTYIKHNHKLHYFFNKNGTVKEIRFVNNGNLYSVMCDEHPQLCLEKPSEIYVFGFVQCMTKSTVFFEDKIYQFMKTGLIRDHYAENNICLNFRNRLLYLLTFIISSIYLLYLFIRQKMRK